MARIHRRTVEKRPVPNWEENILPPCLFKFYAEHDPDNHDGVITDLEPEILECEVKWALER